jgi:hypothetical protein
MAIDIKRLSAPKIGRDGSVKFSAHGTKGAIFAIAVKIEQLESLIESLVELHQSAKLSQVATYHGKETYGMRDEEGWIDPPIAILVKKFQQVDNDTGGFFLRLENLQGQAFDISFQPEHAAILKRMILDNGTKPADPVTH